MQSTAGAQSLSKYQQALRATPQIFAAGKGHVAVTAAALDDEHDFGDIEVVDLPVLREETNHCWQDAKKAGGDLAVLWPRERVREDVDKRYPNQRPNAVKHPDEGSVVTRRDTTELENEEHSSGRTHRKSMRLKEMSAAKTAGGKG